VVVPLSDNWGTETAPIFGWGTLFAVFAVVAIVTWAIFRRLNSATPSSPEAAARRQRSRR
jgi:predicted MFS family arabinose efflux permease